MSRWQVFTIFAIASLAPFLYVDIGEPAVLLGAGEAPTTQATQPAGRIIFAAPFENQTGDEQYDPAAAGMGDLIAVMLAGQENITVVERQRLDALTDEQAAALKGLTGKEYAVAAGKLLEADTVLVGRLFLVDGKLTVSAQALEIETARVAAADQQSCRPEFIGEASLQIARNLASQMALPLPKIDMEKLDKSPIASLHFAKGISHYYAGNMDAAIMQFMRTMDLDPDFIEAHYWSGMAYQRLGEDAHAIIEWENFLRREPESDKAEKVKQLLAGARQRQSHSTVQPLGPDATGGSDAPSTRPSDEAKGL